jgi:hypothetical protein
MLGTVVSTGGLTARYKAPAGLPLGNPVVVSVDFRNENGLTRQLTSRITITGGSYAGTITRTTGTGALGEKAVYHVTWTSLGINGFMEEFTATGTIDYTPPTSQCPTYSFSPTSASILKSGTFMIIDRSEILPVVTVTASAEWGVHECNDCGGTPDCHDYDFVIGFQNNRIGTVSDDGKTVTGNYFDAGSGETWEFTFTR